MKLKKLGISKIQQFNQVTIVKEAVDKIGPLEKGDTIGFFEVEGTPGIVVIAKMSLVISRDAPDLKVD